MKYQVKVYANEDDTAWVAGTNFSPDVRGASAGAVCLRAERQGIGRGRVYLIVVKAVDASGNVGVSGSTVVVPKSQSKADIEAVNAMAAAAKAYSLANGGAPPPGYVVTGDGPIIGPKQ